MKVGNPVEWIKNTVRLCINNSCLEEERKVQFIQLEKEFEGFSNFEKDKIKNIMITQFEAQDLLYLLSMLIKYIKAQLFKEMLLETIEREEFSYSIGSMLEYQIMVHIKGEYVWKRMFHKKNMDSFLQALNINFPYIPSEKRNKNRIVIVTGQLLQVEHAPTRVVLEIAYVLQKCMGYEIMLFVCPCNGVLPENFWHNSYCEESSIEEYDNMPMEIAYQEKKFKGYQISMNSCCIKEYSMMLSLIYAWNPMFVLDCATGNPVVGVAGIFTSVVSFPMSLDCPVSEGEVLIRIGKRDDKTESEFLEALGEKQTQLFMKEKFPVIAKASHNSYLRSSMELPNEKFLIAIVGNRLKFDVGIEFVQVMQKILEEMSNVDFVFVGKKEGLEAYFDKEIFVNRIHYLGYCKDLIGIYQILDLYLNPRRSGGGFSSAMALLSEVPVVTLPDCDVAYNCGEEFIVQDYEEMTDIIYRYVTDKDFYEEKKNHARRYKERNSQEKLVRFVKEMVSGIEKTISE